jgi:aryl-alcohol dehydrogenase-like predicted oxidoreductase
VGLPVGSGPNDRGLSRKRVITSCHASLHRLRTDHIDLYQAHRSDEKTPLEETVAAFADLVRKGDVLYVGVSEWTPMQLREGQRLAREAGISIVSNQPQYSILWRVPEGEVIPACAELGIGQIAYSPLAQGVLAGKYPPSQAIPVGSRAHRKARDGSIRRYMSDELRCRVERLRLIAESLNLSIAQLAVAWVSTTGNSPLPSSARPSPIKYRRTRTQSELGWILTL